MSRIRIGLSRAMVALGCVFAAGLLGQSARAATYMWDASGNGSQFDGTGTWSLTGSNWWNSTDQLWPNNSTSVAQFGFGSGGSTPYTVTLTQATSANGLVFQNQAYTLNSSGGTLFLGGSSPTITTNATSGGTISAPLVSTTTTTTITGAGDLTIAGVANFTGQSVNLTPASSTSGTLQVASGANISATNFSLFQNGVSSGTVAYIQTGGSMNVATNFEMAESTAGGDTNCVNIATVSGGTLTAGALQFYKWAGTPTLNLMGAGLVSTPDLYTGWADSAPASTINIGNGATFSGGTSIYNGGTSGILAASFGINTSSRGANTINFNGGTLRATSAVATLYSGGNGPGSGGNGTTAFLPGGDFTVNVDAAGGIIDNGGFAINIGQSLAHGAGSPDGGMVFQGSGTTTLSGASTYNGGTTINAGTLAYGAANALLGTGAINVNGGALNLLTFSGSAGAVTLTNGSIAGTTGVLTGTSYSVQNGSIGAILAGGGAALTKSTTGTVTLAGNDTYTGSTSVNAGSLLLGGGTINGGSAITVAGSATFGGQGSAGAVSVNAGGSVQGGVTGGSLALTGLTFNGSGGLTFASLANAYTTSPAIAVTGNNSLVTSGVSSISINVASSAGASVGTVYELLGYSGAIGGSGTSAFQIGSLGGRTTGALSFPNGFVDLTITGYNYLYWSGSVSTAWDTTTPNWTLSSNGGTATYIDNPGDIVVFDDRAGANGTVNIASAVHPASVTFSNTASSYLLQGGAGIAGATGVTVNGAGLVTFANSNTYTGPTTISSGTLQLGTGASGQDGSINSSFVSLGSNGTLVYDLASSPTLSLAVSGAGNLVKAGSNTLFLTGASSFGGTTTVSGGTLEVNNAGALGTSNVVANAALVYNLSSGSITNAISGSGSVSNINATGPITIAQNIAMTGGSFTFNDASGPITIAQNIAMTGNNLTLNSVGGAINSGGGISVGSGTGNIGSVSTGSAQYQILGTTSLSASGAGVLTIGGTINTTGGGNAGLLLAGSLTTAGNINLNGVNNGSEWGIEYGGGTSYITASSGTTTLTADVASNSAGKSPYLLIGSPTVNLNAAAGAAIVLQGGAASATGINIFRDYSGGTVFNTNGAVAFIATTSDPTSAFWSGSPQYNVASGSLLLNGGVTGMTNGLKVNSSGSSVVTIAGSGSGTMSGAMTINGSLLDYNVGGSGVVDQTGAIGGAGALAKNGGGTLILGAANGYGGGTTVSAGSLQLGGAAALGSGAAPLTVSGGILDIYGYSPTAGAVTLASGSILNSPGAPGAALIASSYNVQSGTASAVLAGGGAALNKTTAGLVVLSGANTYDGGTTISAGTISAASIVVNGGASNLGSGTSPIVLGDNSGDTGTLNYTGVSTTFTYGFAINPGGGQINSATPGQTLTIDATGIFGSGPLAFGGAGNTTLTAAVPLPGGITSLAKSGTGTLTLGGDNAYTGATTVTGGGLYLNGANSTTSIALAGGATLGGSGSAPSASANVANGGILDFSQNTGTFSLAGLTFTGGGTINVGGLANYSSVPVVSAGALSTSGAVNIDANFGSVTVLAGTYDIISYTGSIGGTGSSVFAVTVNGLGSRQQAHIADNANQIDVVVSGATPYWSGAQSDWLATNAWTLKPGNTPTTFQTGDSDVFDDSASSGSVTINSGNVSPGSVVFANSGLAYVVGGSFGITGSTSLAVVGGGSVTLATSNGYTGGTNLTSGALNLNAAQALGSGTLAISGGTLNVSYPQSPSSIAFSGGLLNLASSSAGLGSGTLTLGGGTLDNTSGAAMTLGGNNPQVWNNSFTFLGSAPLNLGTGAVTLISAPTVYVSGSTLTVGGAISGGGALVTNGGGTLLLTASESYGGSTTISGGTLQLGDGTSGHDASLPGATVTNNATLAYNLYGNQAPSYAIGGSGSVATFGPSVLTFNGANGYSGGTTIGGGTLQVGNLGALGSGPVLDNAALVYNVAGGTLNNAISGSGSVSNTGATGSLTFGQNIALTGGGNFTFNSVGATIASGVNLSVGTGAGTIASVSPSNAELLLEGVTSLSASGTGSISLSGQVDTTGGGYAGLQLTGAWLTTAGDITLSGKDIGNEWGIEFSSGVSQIMASSGTTTLVGDSVASNSTKSPYLFIGGATVDLTANPGAAIVLTGGAGSGTNLATFCDYSVGATFNVSGNVSFIAATTDPTSAFWGKQNSGGAGGGAPNFYVASGSTLLLNGGVTNMTTGLTINSTDSLVTIEGAGSGTLSGAMAINGGTLDYNLGGTVTQSGLVSGYGAVVVNGTGEVIFNAANTYTGETSLSGGTLQLGNYSALSYGALAVNGGTLDLNGYSVAASSFSGAAGAVTNSAYGQLATFDVIQPIATTFAGTLADGAGQLALEVDSGTLTLSGINTYSGGTLVDQTGMLVLANNEALADGSNLTVGDASAFTNSPASPAAGASLAAVPEPGTLLLLACGFCVAAIRRRKWLPLRR